MAVLCRGARGVAVALLLLASLASAVELSFQVDPQQEQCLYEQVPEGAEVEAKVMVYRGGKLDVRLRVEAPDSKVQYNALLFSNLDAKGKLLDTIVKKGTTFVSSQAGTYAFCVDNRMAKYTAKHVVFDLNVRDPNSAAAKAAREAEEAAAKPRTGTETAQDSVQLMRLSTQRIMGKLYQINDAQLYHYHRERRHRDTIESTNDRVNRWSAGETLVLLSATGLQVLLIRRWFKVSYKGALPGAMFGV